MDVFSKAGIDVLWGCGRWKKRRGGWAGRRVYLSCPWPLAAAVKEAQAGRWDRECLPVTAPTRQVGCWRRRAPTTGWRWPALSRLAWESFFVLPAYLASPASIPGRPSQQMQHCWENCQYSRRGLGATGATRATFACSLQPAARSVIADCDSRGVCHALPSPHLHDAIAG